MLIADYSDVNFSSVAGNDSDHDMAFPHLHQDLVDDVVGLPDAFYDYSTIESNEELNIMRDLFSTAAFTGPSLMSASEEDTYQAFIAPDMLQNPQSIHGSTVPDEVPGVKITPAPQVKQPKKNKTVKRKSSVLDDNSSQEERRQRRLFKNRLAARECREKKKQHVQTLKERIQQLEDENKQLRQHIHELNEKLARFAQNNNTTMA